MCSLLHSSFHPHTVYSIKICPHHRVYLVSHIVHVTIFLFSQDEIFITFFYDLFSLLLLMSRRYASPGSSSRTILRLEGVKDQGNRAWSTQLVCSESEPVCINQLQLGPNASLSFVFAFWSKARSRRSYGHRSKATNPSSIRSADACLKLFLILLLRFCGGEFPCMVAVMKIFGPLLRSCDPSL